jgi:DNA polymerase-3 subunit beta
MPANKLTVERAHLVAALTQATKAVETRNTYPILANVYLAASDDRLTLRATDLDIEITTSVPAQGELAATTVPARTLLDIARKMPAGAEITLEPNDGHLVVKAGRSRFKLSVIDAGDFPSLQSGAFTASFSADLSAMFAPIQFAISDEASRYYLNGIFLHTVGEETRAVATDGHRLARVTVPTVGEIPAVIIPKKTVGLLPDGEVHVELSDTKIRFRSGETTILSKLIEGSFPDYERVIPKNNERHLVVDRAALLAAVERVGVVADDRSGKSVRLDLASDSVTLNLRGADDEATEELAAEYGDEPMSVGVNTAYLAEMLRNVSGEKVTFAFGDEGSPILVRGGDAGWLGVQMPRRVN